MYVDTSSKKLQWIYDKNLLNFFNEKKLILKDLAICHLILFFLMRFSDNFFSNKVIDIIQPSLENYKPTQLDLQNILIFFLTKFYQIINSLKKI